MVTIVKADTSSLSIVMYIGRALARYEYTPVYFVSKLYHGAD
jgi:hypothetical protein